MSRVNSFIGGGIRYYKYRPEGEDTWYAGKTEGRIPRGSYPISLLEYCEMSFGKRATRKAIKHLKQVRSYSKGALQFEVSQSTDHLPDANSPEFSKLINNK